MSKANPDDLRALAKKFSLEIVWGPSDLTPENTCYMLAQKPGQKDTKAAIIQLTDGSFTSNKEIPGMTMTPLPNPNQAKKFRINV